MTAGREGRAAATLVVAGSATRDLDATDPRGWRLGGAAPYAALAAARLGTRVTCFLGADRLVEAAPELHILRTDGVDLRLVRIPTVPLFANVEQADGRRQRRVEAGSPMVVPEGAAVRDSAACLLAPVADELTEAWLDLAADGLLALGAQGWLRRVSQDGTVTPGGVLPSAVGARADIVGLSAEDVTGATTLASVRGLARPGATTLLTMGPAGGIAILGRRLVTWPASRTDRVVDPTGAGDVFLGAYLAALLAHDRPGAERRALRIAAAAASCSVEGLGLGAVPHLAVVRARLRR